jgi:alpha-mannosidase
VGPWRFGFALLPHAGSWESGGVLAASEAYQHPFLTARGTAGQGDGTVAAVSPLGIRLAGEGVVLSALRRRDDWLEIRIVAEHPAATVATLRAAGPFVAAREVDLLGRIGSDVAIDDDGAIRLELQAWEIRTIRVRIGSPPDRRGVRQRSGPTFSGPR